jgi:hypothetical protein
VTHVSDGITSQVPHVALKLSTYPDALDNKEFGGSSGAHPDWVAYSNSNLVVPAHSVVTITVSQYDSGEKLNNSYFGNVIGTLDGTATLNGQSFTHVDPDHIGHTFTLRGLPSQGNQLFVSVPLPAADGADSCDPASPDNSICQTIGEGYYTKEPNVITFSFYVGDKGLYEWNCEYPCGGSRIGQFGEAMSTFGYMSGTLTVK